MNYQLNNIKFQLNDVNLQLDKLIQNMGFQNIGMQIYNMGIQTLKIGMQIINLGNQIPSISMIDSLNLKQQIQTIGIQIQNMLIQKEDMNNMGMQINNMNYMGMQINNMNNMGMQINNMNNMGMQIYNLNNMGMPTNNLNNNYDFMKESSESKQNNSSNSKMIYSVVFNSVSGNRWVLILDEDITVEGMLKKFFNKICETESIDYEKDFFLFNGKKIEFGDKTKIKELFEYNNRPSISYIDVHN